MRKTEKSRAILLKHSMQQENPTTKSNTDWSSQGTIFSIDLSTCPYKSPILFREDMSMQNILVKKPKEHDIETNSSSRIEHRVPGYRKR